MYDQWRSASIFAFLFRVVHACTNEFLRFLEKKLVLGTGRIKIALRFLGGVHPVGRPQSGITWTTGHVSNVRSGDRHNRNICARLYRCCLGSDAVHSMEKNAEVSLDTRHSTSKPRRNWAVWKKRLMEKSTKREERTWMYVLPSARNHDNAGSPPSHIVRIACRMSTADDFNADEVD